GVAPGRAVPAAPVAGVLARPPGREPLGRLARRTGGDSTGRPAGRARLRVPQRPARALPPAEPVGGAVVGRTEDRPRRVVPAVAHPTGDAIALTSANALPSIHRKPADVPRHCSSTKLRLQRTQNWMMPQVMSVCPNDPGIAVDQYAQRSPRHRTPHRPRQAPTHRLPAAVHGPAHPPSTGRLGAWPASSPSPTPQTRASQTT